MDNRGNMVGGFGTGLLLGVAIGATLALLYAPRTGRETRRLIREKAEEAWDTGAKRVEEIREQASETLGKARQRVDKMVHGLKVATANNGESSK